jgi:hypothetical protein
MFGDQRGDRSDLRAIDAMMASLQLDWDDSRLASFAKKRAVWWSANEHASGRSLMHSSAIGT